MEVRASFLQELLTKHNPLQWLLMKTRRKNIRSLSYPPFFNSPLNISALHHRDQGIPSILMPRLARVFRLVFRHETKAVTGAERANKRPFTVHWAFGVQACTELTESSVGKSLKKFLKKSLGRSIPTKTARFGS